MFLTTFYVMLCYTCTCLVKGYFWEEFNQQFLSRYIIKTYWYQNLWKILDDQLFSFFFRHVLRSYHKCLNRIEKIMWPCHFVHNAVFELTFWHCCCVGCHRNGCRNVFGRASDVCVRADVECGGGQRNGLQRSPVEDIIWCQHHQHGGLCKWPIRLSLFYETRTKEIIVSI